jgi:threonine dehydrogenase-like Zn-dependent dehydrogenase
VERVRELTDGLGVDAAIECVGTGEAMATAIDVTRPGAMVGYVGVPHGVELPIRTLFRRNIGVHGGSAPARTYIPELLGDVLDEKIEPGRVFDFETDLDGIAEAYAAMDERRAIKSLVRVASV